MEYVEVERAKDTQPLASIVRHDKILSPGIIGRAYGEGKVIYLATPIERLYKDGGGMEAGVEEISSLFNSLINWLTDGALLYRIDAPPGVFTNLFSKDGKYILHLVNYTGTNYEYPHTQMKYISQVKDVACEMKIQESIKEVRAVMLKGNLKFSQNGGYISFTLPVLYSNEVVVVEKR